MTQTDKAAEADPVAWRHLGDNGFSYTTINRVAEIWCDQGCTVTPLYAHPRDAESLRGENERLKDELLESRDEAIERVERAEAEIDRLTDALSIWIDRAEKAEAEVARLTADLATSRAETAMAFEVAAKWLIRAGIAGDATEDPLATCILALTPADATAALAARDKAKDARIAHLEAALTLNHDLDTISVGAVLELRAENARLREALAPFAKAGELFATTPAMPDCYAVLYNPAAGPEYQITEQHVRAAWAALQSEVSHDRT